MDIQAAIDALPLSGGIVQIPVGIHAGSHLVMRDNVILQGQGMGTVIPPIAGCSTRLYGLGLRDLIVDATLAPGTPGYAIDWRNVSQSHIFNVIGRGGTLALLLAYASQYVSIIHFFGSATICGAELYASANQHTFIGGKLSAPKGLNIQGSNGATIVGTALEDAVNNMVFKTISGDDGSTRAVGVRQEDANHSSTYWNQ